MTNLIMQEGFGALAKVPPKYIPANDNVASGGKPEGWTDERYAAYAPEADLGEHVVSPRSAWSDLATTTFAPLETLPVAPQPATPQPASRLGDFMQTYTGRQFWPLDPREDEVCIEDIAHSLAMQCRYAGHCIQFYSVAEHSVHIAWWLHRHADATTALMGLLHDASEAYLIDVPRPVKPFLDGYKSLERWVQNAVMRSFQLPEQMPAAAKEADDRIIADELVNLKPMDWHRFHDDPLGVKLAYWSPAEAEERFLSAFHALMAEVKREEV
jgi:hypothetical protein